MIRPFLALEHPLRFAHRGSRVLWPENTMVAFQGARDLGYRYIETDVHVSRDGKVVLFHDDRLERLTDGEGRVDETDWDRLRTLNAAAHFGDGHSPAHIPLLEEALRSFPNMHFNLDLKQQGIEAVVAAEIRRLGVEDRVLVGSFYDLRLRRFRAASAGRVATSAGPMGVVRAVGASLLGRPVSGPADALQVPPRVVTRRLLASAKEGAVQVHVWTVNEADEMRSLLDRGVDGLVTDRPDILNQVLGVGGGD